jgi:hypothetical protein
MMPKFVDDDFLRNFIVVKQKTGTEAEREN